MYTWAGSRSAINTGEGIDELAARLKKENFELHVLSGDNNSEKEKLVKLFDKNTQLLFNQSPQQKLDFIKSLQNVLFPIQALGVKKY